MWNYTGQKRPAFAPAPKHGQESVWDYPRPPRLESTDALVEVWNGKNLIARSVNSIRLLETASPPQYYIPPQDVRQHYLNRRDNPSACEWKGIAHYWVLSDDEELGSVGWGYREAHEPYGLISGYYSFYAGLVRCYVNGERVRPQPGRFYGGWITSGISGPFKGAPGTGHW